MTHADATSILVNSSASTGVRIQRVSALFTDPWLATCVSRCQFIAGQIGHLHPYVLLSEIKRIATDLPPARSVVDEWLLRGLLAQVVSRVLRIRLADANPQIGQAFLAFASAGLTPGAWQREFRYLLDTCFEWLRKSGALDRCVQGPQTYVEQALRVIDEGYSDPNLALSVVAAKVGLSPSHLSRLFTARTRTGFIFHLHDRRVFAARFLLIESRLSIKEIAADVGYMSVTQLKRHFKRSYGTTPLAMRTESHRHPNEAAHTAHTPQSAKTVASSQELSAILT